LLSLPLVLNSSCHRPLQPSFEYWFAFKYGSLKARLAVNWYENLCWWLTSGFMCGSVPVLKWQG
jgi:hypothetical protein